MPWPYSDTVEQNHRVGSGSASSSKPSVALLWWRLSGPNCLSGKTPFSWTKTHECFNKREDWCLDIVEGFLALLNHLFLSYCDSNDLYYRYPRNQTQEELLNDLPRLICVIEYEDSALIARWIRQINSALEYVEKNGLLTPVFLIIISIWNWQILIS